MLTFDQMRTKMNEIFINYQHEKLLSSINFMNIKLSVGYFKYDQRNLHYFQKGLKINIAGAISSHVCRQFPYRIIDMEIYMGVLRW